MDENELENPIGKLWADNVARINITKYPTPNGRIDPLNPLLSKKLRLFNGATKGLGALMYGEKLGQAKTKKEALDAILGIMFGGLPMAVYGITTPTDQRLRDQVDIMRGRKKTIMY